MNDIYDIKPKATLYFSQYAPNYLPEDWWPWFYEPLKVLLVRRPLVNRKKTEAVNLKLMNPNGQVLTLEGVSVDWCLKWLVTPDERIPTPMGLVERGHLIERQTNIRV